MRSSRASEDSSSPWRSSRPRSSVEASTTFSGSRLPGLMSISERMRRTPMTHCLTQSISASAASSMREASAVGQGCSEIVSPDLPASGPTCCQSASVMNGMIGWASLSVASRTRSSVRRVASRAASSSPFRTGLAISRYQSQYSFHRNS